MNKKELIEKIKTSSTKASNEEQTKNSLILPFFKYVGFDVFDLDEVEPEFVADVGLKKGEKVDYVLKHEGEPFVIVECKNVTEDLSLHYNQLYRYFSSLPNIRLAVLTNGIEYRVYTDKNNKNILDPEPFVSVNILNDDISALEYIFKHDIEKAELIIKKAALEEELKRINDILNVSCQTECDDSWLDYNSTITGFKITAVKSKNKVYNGSSFKECFVSVVSDLCKNATVDDFKKIGLSIVGKDAKNSSPFLVNGVYIKTWYSAEDLRHRLLKVFNYYKINKEDVKFKFK